MSKRLLLWIFLLLGMVLPSQAVHADAVSEFFRYYPQWRERSSWQQIVQKGEAAASLCQKRQRYEEEALIRARVGASHIYLGDHDHAETQVRASLELAEQYQYQSVKVRALGLLSGIYRMRALRASTPHDQQRFFGQAESLAVSALKHYEEAGLQIVSLKAKVLCELSALYADRVELHTAQGLIIEEDAPALEKARKGFEEAMELFALRNLMHDYRSAAVRYGQVLLQMDRVAESRAILDELRAEIRRPKTHYHWEALKARVEAAEGKPLKALQTAAVARSKAEELGATDDARRLQVLVENIEADLIKQMEPCPTCGGSHGTA